MSRSPLRPRSVYRHWAPVLTRWHDNDIYGHVNNVLYYNWLDTAVNGWLMKVGLLRIGVGDPVGLVVESGCTYASSISFPDKIEVGLRLARLGNSSVTYHLGIFVEGADDASAEGHFTHVYVGRADYRPKALPDEWRAILKTLE